MAEKAEINTCEVDLDEDRSIEYDLFEEESYNKLTTDEFDLVVEQSSEKDLHSIPTLVFISENNIQHIVEEDEILVRKQKQTGTKKSLACRHCAKKYSSKIFLTRHEKNCFVGEF